MFKFAGLRDINYVNAYDCGDIELPILILPEMSLDEEEFETEDSQDNLAEVEPIEEMGPITYDSNNLKPSIGCLLTHFSVFKHALENNYDQIAVFEDDIGFSQTIINDRNVLDSIPEDWQFIALNELSLKKHFNDEFCECIQLNDTNAYIINKEAMQDFVLAVEQEDWVGANVSFLCFMDWVLDFNQHASYSPTTPLVYHNFNRVNKVIDHFVAPVAIPNEYKEQLLQDLEGHNLISE
jgi:GR25 family glycosyltransferase involved in LPS biosynthesis